MKVERREAEAVDLARTLMVLSNYEWVRQKANDIDIEVIPIKGIDLLQTLYSENLNRPVRDIDLLCRNEADCRMLAETLCANGYRLEFPFALEPEALAAKHKVSLLSNSTTRVNIDIHTAFVTKKFFSQAIGRFNDDALSRCENSRMEPLDRWLFLAQHAAFHLFSDDKWIVDLRLLYDAFTPEQRKALALKAANYGFRRVMAAALWHCYHGEPAVCQELLNDLHLSWAERRFMNFVCHFNRPFSHHAFDRLIANYWEFAFIDRRRLRYLAWLRLMLPKKGMLTNIYRIKHPLALLFFYPLNLLISGFTSLLFWTVYALRASKAFCQ